MTTTNGYTTEQLVAYGKISAASYRDEGSADTIQIGENFSGHTVVDVSFGSGTGFDAIAMTNDTTGELVIAYQGSQDWQDWVITDGIGVVGGHVITNQTPEAISFATNAINNYGQGDNVTFTGHSLGGYLAQTVAALSGFPSNAVVFNSPGVAGLVGEVVDDWFHINVSSLNFTYIYSEDWGAAGAVHGYGTRLTDDVFYVEDTAGHGIGDLIIGLENSQNDIIRFSSTTWADAISNSANAISSSGSNFVDTIWQAYKNAIEFFADGVHSAIPTYNIQELMRQAQNNCFTSGTPILLADGTAKPIEDIQLNDSVLAPNGLGDVVPSRVTKLFENTTQEFVRLSFDDGREDLIGTPGHRFMTETGDFMEIGHMLKLGGGTSQDMRLAA